MDYNFITYGLTFISLIITLIAQSFVSSSYSKYSKIRNKRGITGSEEATYLLDKIGSLTKNEMKVVSIYTNDLIYEDYQIDYNKGRYTHSNSSDYRSPHSA